MEIDMEANDHRCNMEISIDCIETNFSEDSAEVVFVQEPSSNTDGKLFHLIMSMAEVKCLYEALLAEMEVLK